MEPAYYARPDGESVVLRESPRLSSWKRSGETAHDRLARAMDHAREVIAPQLAGLDAPAAVRLDIGLHRLTPLLDQRDLDNFLIPLIGRLQDGLSAGVVSAWASKHVDDKSLLRVEAARAAPSRPAVLLTGSRPADSVEFMQEIHDQVAGLDPLPPGPVTVELGFVVGPEADWVPYWKPVIDALGPLVGEGLDGRAWHPQDGRIVDLGLHKTVDPDLTGDDVRVALIATAGPLT